MNNILVTGADGQLGSEIRELSKNHSDYSFIFTDKKNLDITKENEISKFFDSNKINAIINCAAYTAVDLAEDETEMANQINHISVKLLAKEAKKHKIKFIHVSTDYVFDGTSHVPYIETGSTNPQSVYGSTKLEGEQILKEISPDNSIIIRTSWVYSSFGNNFVKTMLRLGQEKESLNVIFDQIGTPTYAKDLANCILNIIPKVKNSEVETFHYSNEGVCSWYDFAKTIFELKKIDCKVFPIPSSAYPTKAKRPHYSVLNKEKIKKQFNIEIPYWKDSLSDCLQLL